MKTKAHTKPRQKEENNKKKTTPGKKSLLSRPPITTTFITLPRGMAQNQTEQPPKKPNHKISLCYHDHGKGGGRRMKQAKTKQTLTPHFAHSSLDVVGFHSFISLSSAWAFCFCAIDLAARAQSQPHQPHLSAWQQKDGRRRSTGRRRRDSGIWHFSLLCWLGCVARRSYITSLMGFLWAGLAWSAGQPASETQRVAGSYTASGWACLACIRSLLTGTLGSLARLNLARHGTARWQWALFPWSFSWWDPGLVGGLAGLVWFGENTAWVAGSCTVCGWAFPCCIRRFLLGLAHWHADSGTLAGWGGYGSFSFFFAGEILRWSGSRGCFGGVRSRVQEEFSRELWMDH